MEIEAFRLLLADFIHPHSVKLPSPMSHRPERAFAFVTRAWQADRLAHGWLISGHETDSEALAARIAALVLGQPDGTDLAALPPDWLRVLRPEKKSRRIPVDSLRQLERFFHLSAPQGQWKLAVLVGADRMMPEAANAFLKTLEEPPDNCLLLLLTEFPERLLPTIRSRCVLLDLDRPAPMLDAEEIRLAELLARFRPGPQVGLPQVAALRQGFQALLDARKEAFVKQREAELAAEKKHYKDRAESGWVAAREETLQAQAQADTLAYRARLAALIGRWLGDALRHTQSDAAPLALPDHAQATAAWAQADGRDRLLQRLEAHARLERLLETNVNEGLLWEVSFLAIFGD